MEVACGTGVLARELARRVCPKSSAVGLDLNADMLSVARSSAPEIEWCEASAEVMPFSDATFDSVLSQFGLMFFADRPAAIREMTRVLRPGGTIVIAVWDGLDNTPGYAAMTALLQHLFGDQTANALRAPYALGDINALRAM